MKLSRIILLGAILLSSIIVHGQDDSKIAGIQWTTGLSWGQVKQKAKTENKYIFLDCFATWCGPCKMMDKDIYPNDSVGDYFNDKFISVRVQMDKTGKDIPFIQSWYNDADAINKQYHVEAYPTFIFLSPNGVIVHKETGASSDIQYLISMAKTATKPGKVYNDVYEEYDRLVVEFNKGIVDYSKLPIMITTASRLGDTTMRALLMKTHLDYVSTLPPQERYTKDNIQFWSSLNLSSKKTLFSFFYLDAIKIDKVMGQKGYAANIVDKTIQVEIVTPFLQEQAAGSGISVTGMYMNMVDSLGKNVMATDDREANWKKLKKIIQEEYNTTIARRNVITARIEWYKRHWNSYAVSKYFLIKLNKYPQDLFKMSVAINKQAWESFLKVTDKKMLNGYIKWMEKVIKRQPRDHNFLDTYASLLYKVGRKKEAIKWEENALAISSQYKKTVEQMKNGQPIYGVMPIQ